MNISRKFSRIVELRVLRHLADQESVIAARLKRIHSQEFLGSNPYETKVTPASRHIVGPVAF